MKISKLAAQIFALSIILLSTSCKGESASKPIVVKDESLVKKVIVESEVDTSSEELRSADEIKEVEEAIEKETEKVSSEVLEEKENLKKEKSYTEKPKSPKPQNTKVESVESVLVAEKEEIETTVENAGSSSSAIDPSKTEVTEANPKPTSTKPTTDKPNSKPIKESTGDKSEVGQETIETNAPKSTSAPLKTGGQVDGLSHQVFDNLLKKYVDGKGVVDYQGIKDSKMVLNRYTQMLAANVPGKDVPKNESLAYWINAYNAFTLKLIVDNYPVNSITDLHGGKPWDKKWIELGGKNYSLNNIENDIIRPDYGDARIHFAVNCAAKSCPPLGNFAYTAENLDSKMNMMTKAFINGSSNEISNNKIVISKIFDWYKSDFGNVVGYFNKYLSTPVDSKAKVSFQEYDWSLNGK